MEKITGWTLFNLRGVAVKVHVSLLFLLMYVVLVGTASFSFVVRNSGIDPTTVSGSPIVWATIFAVSIIVSVFLHEFAHVLVAQAHGFKVRAITLMMLGGMSQMEKIPEKPSVEFKVSIIGPIVSLAIGGLLLWMRRLFDSPNAELFCYWIGQANVVLGIFNLIPAFPTDGGRVLRAFLVTRNGRLRGTQIAVQVSHVFAWIFGILGFLQLNLLLILVAFFIYRAAKSEFFILWGQTVLKGKKVSDLLTVTPVISESESLVQAVEKMKRTKNLLLPVIGSPENRLILSHEYVQKIPRHLWETTRVKSVAIEVPKAVKAEDTLDEIWHTALTTPARGVPVIEDNRVVGIIKTSDLVEAIAFQQLDGETKPPALGPWSQINRSRAS